MPVFADVQHAIFDTSNRRTEKDACWTLTNIRNVDLCSFDASGRYCAVFKSNQQIEILSSNTLLTSVATFSVTIPSIEIASKDVVCNLLVWSQNGRYLLGSFSVNTNKRKLEPTRSSYLITWDIMSLSLFNCIIIPKSVQNIWALASSSDNHYFLYQSIPNSAGYSNLYILDILNSSIFPFQISVDSHGSILAPTTFYKISEYSSWNSYMTPFSMIISSTIPQIYYHRGTSSEELSLDLCFIKDSKILCLIGILLSKSTDSITCQLGFIASEQLEAHGAVKKLEFSKFEKVQVQFENDLLAIYSISKPEKKFKVDACITSSVVKNCKFISSYFFLPTIQTFSDAKISKELIIITIMIGGQTRLNNDTTSTGLLIWNLNNSQFRIFYNNFDSFETNNFDNSRLSHNAIIFQYYLQPCTSLLLLGIDKFGRLLSCNDLWHSKFAGAMYPVNYDLVEQVTAYEELEEEFDVCTARSKSDVPLEIEHSAINLFSLHSQSFNQQAHEIAFDVEFHLENQTSVVPHQKFFISFQSNPNLSCLHTIANNSIDEESATIAASTEVEESSSIHRKRSAFVGSIQSIIPTPRGIVSGDYHEKQQRLKQLSEGISGINSDPIYRSERSQNLIEEAVEMIKHQVEQNHLKTLKRLEKQKKRAFLREQTLNQLLEIAVNTQPTQQLSTHNVNLGSHRNGNSPIKVIQSEELNTIGVIQSEELNTIGVIQSEELNKNRSCAVGIDEIRSCVQLVIGHMCDKIVNQH